MPSLSNFSLSRWIGLCQLQSCHRDSFHNGRDNPISTTIECYACTPVGLPVFHSTSCDQAHPPQWEASAGSSLVPIHHRKKITRAAASERQPSGPFGTVLDPRSKRVQRWNRAFLLARGMALAIDPLFFYALSIGRGGSPCLYMDGGLAAVVTVLRTGVDAVHLFHLWLQFRLAYVSRESLVVGCGKLVWDPRAIASLYIRSLKGFWFDAFVILPVPQGRANQAYNDDTDINLLVPIPPKSLPQHLLNEKDAKGHRLHLRHHLVAGGCWYVLAIQRVALCLQQQCGRNEQCKLSLSCSNEVCYQGLFPAAEAVGNACGGNSTRLVGQPLCLDVDGPFNYGIYQWALPVVSSNSLAVKIFYPIFWGLMSLSTFGNDLEPTSHWLEVMFSICIVLAGLLLFTLLIGNIQVFLHAVMAKKRKMQLRCRDIEWWMKRRQLPSHLRQRVRHFECQKWVTLGGEDEMEIIKDLPEGLRRDIKRYLCLDLIKKVPLFHNLDDLILDNICDRVKPLFFSRDEKITREGDPVQRMVFIVRGRIISSQSLSKGMVATSIIRPGGFFGDELLSWCLRRPFMDRLPASSATSVCAEPIEAFGLDANHLRYITDHFRYKFANERLKRTARYYSSNWRTWAAVNIQLSWRRYRTRTKGPMISATQNGNSSDRRLLQYAALFMSIRPHDHLE
ncbi:hypothetical protein V6N11_040640 [Hibiscus sabdariffa]|uniref:Cyclic nucleotide-binding domain-containing protein n=1 Tax=Hibiscus sabdariffa TaxID=183260 RepID=A0ABR2RI23_9ROSI